MTADDLDALTKVDRTAFGADRSFFLRLRFEKHPHLCRTLIRDDMRKGFIMGQPGNNVVTVGPWLIESSGADPLALLRSLALKVSGSKLRLGVLETNTAAVGLLRKLNSLSETEPSWRMVLGSDCGLGTSNRLIAIGSPAKG